MIYKFDLSISGTNFFPEKIIGNFVGDLIIDSYFNPRDKKNEEQEFEYGSISFSHPKKNASDNQIIKYEKSYVEFIENNYLLLIENGAEDFQIFLEIYYEGDQCNFELFNKNLLKRISTFGISLPISIYKLDEVYMNEWEKEIEADWML